ncbi:terpene synthase family protein [Actinomycetes bacterium KLBMP 9759]
MAGVRVPERQHEVLEIDLPTVSDHPFPVACRPDFPHIEKAVNEWAWRHLPTLPGVTCDRVLRLVGQAFPLWISLAYPDGSTATATRVGRWMYFWFLLDDLAGEPPEPGTDRPSPTALLDGLKGALMDPAHPAPEPFARLLQGLWSTLGPSMPPPQRARFTDSVVRMLDGFATTIRLASAGTAITLDEYRDLRYDDSGMPWTFLLTEYCAGIDLSADIARNARLRELLVTSVWNTALANDVIAFGKEFFAGDDWNAVSIVAREQGLSVQDAMDRVAGLARDEERRIVALCDELAACRPGSDLHRFLQGHQRLLSGTLEWQYRSSRYHGPGYAWTGYSAGPVTVTRAGTRPHRVVPVENDVAAAFEA